MALVVPAAIYILALTYLYGSVAIIWLDKSIAPANRQRVPFFLLNILGLVVLAEIAGYLSVFMKIGMAAHLIVVLTGIVLYLLNRKAINRLGQDYLGTLGTANKFTVAIFLLLCALTLINTVDRPKVGDTGLYHLQTIKWIAHYGVVPGLGNLHGMFALNSMWYPVSALFGLEFLGIQTLHILNGVLFLLVVGFFLGGVTDLLEGSTAPASIIKAAAIAFSLFAYAAHIGSASTDLPVALLIWVAFILCLENVDPDQISRSGTIAVILVLLTAYTLTLKLSAIPLAILYLYLLYLQYQAKRWAAVWSQIGLGLIILTPWLVRNVMLSGYLVYPFPYLDLFSVDWKIPYQNVIEYKFVNHGWARLPGPQWQESLEMPLSEWLPQWFKLEHTYKVTIAAAFLTMPVYIIWTVRSQRQGAILKVRDILYLIACGGAIFWFINAPDPRFGFGFIFLVLILPAAPLLQHIVRRLKGASHVCMLAILILYIVYKSYTSIQTLPKTVDTLWAPVPYPTDALWSKRIGNIVFYGPRTGFCWDAPLPCTDVLKDQIHPRGDSLESGFRMAKAEPGR
jgi:hypothetical protein